MIRHATLQRIFAVYAVMLGAIAAEVWLLTTGAGLLPGPGGRLLTVVVALGTLFAFLKLEAWERKKRQEDQAAVDKVVETARAASVEAPEDRAIFIGFLSGSETSVGGVAPPPAVILRLEAAAPYGSRSCAIGDPRRVEPRS